MFLPILYVVFYPFSFMLQIVHVQSVYNINKPVGTICMIFIDFSRFFLPREAPKPAQNRSGKPVKPVSLSEIHSVYRSDSSFSTF
jgi:hypothetical protein